MSIFDSFGEEKNRLDFSFPRKWIEKHSTETSKKRARLITITALFVSFLPLLICALISIAQFDTLTGVKEKVHAIVGDGFPFLIYSVTLLVPIFNVLLFYDEKKRPLPRTQFSVAVFLIAFITVVLYPINVLDTAYNKWILRFSSCTLLLISITVYYHYELITVIADSVVDKMANASANNEVDEDGNPKHTQTANLQ